MTTATKDCIEVGYWVINTLILIATVYYIYKSPLDAVKIGRQLNDEQEKIQAKRELFLTLYASRGNMTSFQFVNSLNQIDVVFQGESKVITAWDKLFTSLNTPATGNVVENWEFLKVDLLSEMAQTLGYNALKQTDIQKTYYPQAHVNQEQSNLDYHFAAREYFESGALMHRLNILQVQSQLKHEDYDNIEQSSTT